jgi:hypothetical protein
LQSLRGRLGYDVGSRSNSQAIYWRELLWANLCGWPMRGQA